MIKEFVKTELFLGEKRTVEAYTYESSPLSRTER
jgi:hypothetical protein